MPAISAVYTIRHFAWMLGEDRDWLHEISIGMMSEDARLWVYDDSDDATLAFTSNGIDNLRDLIEMHREDAARKQNANPRA